MVMKGHIYRGRKPVHWSPSSRTALAEAELEYPEGHKSRSIYVSLPVTAAAASAAGELAAALEGAAFAVWTTTPWTIPANLAVAVNDRLQYSVVQVRCLRQLRAAPIILADAGCREGWPHGAPSMCALRVASTAPLVHLRLMAAHLAGRLQ